MTAPVAFFGHGSPTNTLERNDYTEAWRRYGSGLMRPTAILVVSAHWYTSGVRVTAQHAPRTIHDFNSRFPKELFDFRYPAPGAQDLIRRVQDLLSPTPVEPDTTWGIDHGAFSVLAHVFPAAEIPVIELSLDRRKSAREHYALAQRLDPLRDEGVFIMGSGNVVHNLELARFTRRPEPFDWASRFQRRVAEIVMQHDHRPIIDYLQGGDDARLSVPTPDHFLPFLYVLAQQRESDATAAITDGVAAGSVGMLSIGFGS